MFVKWREKPLSPRTRNGRRGWGPLLIAELVESYRNKDGKPRQRHIAYLASNYEGVDETLALSMRYQFWKNARVALDRLGVRVSPLDRIKIEAALEKRVPEPYKEIGYVPKRRWGKYAGM